MVKKKIFLLFLVLFLLADFVLAADLPTLAGYMFNETKVIARGQELQAQHQNIEITKGGFYWRLGLAGVMQHVIPHALTIILINTAYIFVGWAMFDDLSAKTAFEFWLFLGIVNVIYFVDLIFIKPFVILLPW